jgi:hypothetical protein
MIRLSREFTLVMVEKFGPGEMLTRLSDHNAATRASGLPVTLPATGGV